MSFLVEIPPTSFPKAGALLVALSCSGSWHIAASQETLVREVSIVFVLLRASGGGAGFFWFHGLRAQFLDYVEPE